MYLDDLDEQSIYNYWQEIKSMVVNMIQNLSHKYFSHNSNIKCVESTINYVYFHPIHYTINMDVISSFMIIRDLDYMFLLMYY